MQGMPLRGNRKAARGADENTPLSACRRENEDLRAENIRLKQAQAEQQNHDRGAQSVLLLVQLGERLITLKHPDEMAELIRQFVEKQYPLASCSLVEIDEQGPRGLTSGNTVLDDLFRDEDGPVILDHLAPDEYPLDQAQRLRENRIEALISFPWFTQDRKCGRLTVAVTTPRAWKDEDKLFLRATAELAGMAIENARMVMDLKRSDEQFRVVLKNLPLTVSMNDLDLRYTWIHRGRMMPSTGQVVGKKDEDLLSPQDAKKLIELKRAVLNSGKGLRQEMDFLVNDKLVHMDLAIEPLRGDDQQIIGLTTAASDISEVVQLREEKHRLDVYQETQRMINQFHERELQKIAEDLHDGPLQEVMAIGFNLAEAMELNNRAERIEAMLTIRAQLQKTAKELRQFCTELRPPALTPFGLEKAIRSHMHVFAQNHPGIRFVLELMPDGLELGEDLRLHLYRIYQELVSNTVRHAQARTVNVRLSVDEAQTELEIQDDGCGTILPEEWLDLAREGRFGLVGVRERVDALGGRIVIRSVDGEGTLVRVIVPTQPKQIKPAESG